MKENVVELTVSQLKEDLSNGLTWLEKENEGYGSIQTKYGATDTHIGVIRQHPKLVGFEPTVTVFRIKDDTDSVGNTEKKEVKPEVFVKKEETIVNKSPEIKTPEIPTSILDKEHAEQSVDAFNGL